MNITKYRHFDSLTYLHVLGITSSGGHTLISGNFRYISANFRSETGSDAAHAVWPVLNVNWVAAPSMWTGVASDPRSESVRREYSNAAWVSAPSMWAECRPPPCGLSARPLHVGSVCGLQSGASQFFCNNPKSNGKSRWLFVKGTQGDAHFRVGQHTSSLHHYTVITHVEVEW